MLSAFEGKTSTQDRKGIIHHSGKGAFAIRSGKWKYIVSSERPKKGEEMIYFQRHFLSHNCLSLRTFHFNKYLSSQSDTKSARARRIHNSCWVGRAPKAKTGPTAAEGKPDGLQGSAAYAGFLALHTPVCRGNDGRRQHFPETLQLSRFHLTFPGSSRTKFIPRY